MKIITTLLLVAGATCLMAEDSKADWFQWRATTDYKTESAIDMSDWQTKAAGSEGRIKRKDDALTYDGKPIKIWGLNVCFDRGCAPPKNVADLRADFYAKNGVNSVRLHKYADGSGWAGILRQGSSTEFDKAALDRMDYFVAALKKRGIFVKLSPTFGSLSIAAEDYDNIPYAREFGGKPSGNKRLKTGGAAIFLSPELQDMQIKQTINLLKHKNPYTGMTYAKDPAIMLVELVNEESALFGGLMGHMQKRPTMRKMAGKLFTEWVLKKYGSEEAITKRWGNGGLNKFTYEKFTNESFADKSVLPVGAPWYWDPVQIQGSQKGKAPRLLDSAEFLCELQNAYYERYSKAIRKAGYDGELMASNWQAGRASSHYYNLYSDREIGLIDRHNYFGGKRTSSSMMDVPGGGMISSGMQQVADRPFSLSEWIHVFPNQWGVEGPAIIGAYGMGLQDWDISYMFQNSDDGKYSSQVGRDQWDVTAPQVFAAFPAIARHVRRNDIATSKDTIHLNVHYPSLAKAKISFEDKTQQAYDIKSFTSDKIPAEMLLVSRVAVNYTDSYKDTKAHSAKDHMKYGAIQSATEELHWFASKKQNDSYFTINTDATKAVVGFAQGKEHELGKVSIKTHSKYGALYLTARSQKGTIAKDKRLLIVAVARAHNTGMSYDGQGKMRSKGKGPVLMEPMKAEFTIKRSGKPTVYICDHNGVRTDKTIPVKNNSFTIDGETSKTVYYEVVY